nr:hypothetical protein [Dictyobacter alpinus]
MQLSYVWGGNFVIRQIVDFVSIQFGRRRHPQTCMFAVSRDALFDVVVEGERRLVLIVVPPTVPAQSLQFACAGTRDNVSEGICHVASLYCPTMLNDETP